ncbi:MAG: CHAT domain-containing protein, partial [Chloroflexi bacterium]|nr:CHAT domain-containing protein [Chloroflexota bacterium]
MEFSPLRDDACEAVLDQALLLVDQEPNQARTQVEQVLASLGDQRTDTYARALYVAGICHTTQGRLASARAALISAQELFEAHGAEIAAACCKREQGIAAYYIGEYDAARTLLTSAQVTLDANGCRVEASRCLIWLATLENFQQASQQAQTYLDAARTCLDGIDAPTEQAACDFVAGMIEARQTHYEQALALFAAAEHRCATLGVAVWLGRVYIEQAYTLFALQRFAAATSAARKARVLFQEHGMPQREAVANDLLAQIATATNQFVAAQQLYELAQLAYEAAGMPVHSAQALIHRANIDYYLGAWDAAETRYRDALKRAQHYGARIPIFVAHSNLGLIAWESGRLDEGLTLTQLALADALSLKRLDDAAHCQIQLAGIYSVLKQHTNAAKHYEAALAMLSQLDKPVSYAEAQLNFAEFCLQAGDGDQARALVEAARRTYAAADMPVMIAHCDLLLAKICLTQRRLDQAAMLVEQCIEQYTADQLPISLARAHMVQGAIAAAGGAIARAQHLYQQAVTVLDKLLPGDAADGAVALAELAESQHDDASALSWRCNAVRWIQQARSRVPTEQFATALTERYAAVLQTTLQHAIRRGEFALALMLAEDARTQVALSWVEGRRRSEPRDPATLAIAERCAKLRQQIEVMQQEQSSAVGPPEDRAARLVELQERYDEALVLWRRFGSQVLPGTPQPFDWPSWLAHLKTQPYRWQVLAYWYTDDQLVIWHATPDTLTCIQRPLEGYDRAAIDLCTRPEYSYRAYVYDRPVDAILQGTSGSPALKQVAALVLLENLAATLTPETLLIVVPAGPLHTLPFAALPLDGDLLVNRCTPLIAPSLHLLRRLNERQPSSAAKTLALGVTQHQEHEPLPYACAEARMVAATVEHTDVWCDAQATVERLQASSTAGRLRQYRQIHCATHAWPDLIGGMQAGIALFNGHLALADLAHLDLDADLVVLSACDSGIGKAYAGEEVVSLTFALLQAGTRALVTSLWPVIDEATPELMNLFYTARQAPMLGPWSF